MAIKKLGTVKLTDNVLITSVTLTTEVTGILPVANGGTGQSVFTDGQLLIGNTTGNTLTKATLTAGSGISITNGGGTITIAATGGGTGDVVGPASATDRAIVIYNSTTGKLVQNSGVTISAANLIAAVGGITVTGAKTTLAAGVAGYASLNIPDGVQTTSIATGDVYKSTAGIFWRDASSAVSSDFTPLPRYRVASADSTHTSTTPSTLTNVSFDTGGTGEVWRFKATIAYASNTATVGIKVQLNTPTFTTLAATVTAAQAAAGTNSTWVGFITASGGQVTATNTPVINTKYICTIEGFILATAAGTVQVLIGVEAAGTVTVYAGSHIEYSRLR